MFVSVLFPVLGYLVFKWLYAGINTTVEDPSSFTSDSQYLSQ